MNTEDDEFDRIEREQKMRGVPDAIHHTDTSETLEYIQGWNDCRQAMLAAQQREHMSNKLIDESTVKLVLKKIKAARDCHPNAVDTLLFEAEEILEIALAEQPAQQEPVAWRYTDARGYYRYRGFVANFDKEYSMLNPQPLYTTPQTQPAKQEFVLPGGGYVPAIPAQQALDKMAENARELGLDYEPSAGTQVSKVWWDGEKLMAKPIPLEDFHKPAQRKPLTDDEIWREYRFLWPFHPAEERKLASDILMFARAIEAAHGIKENT